MAYRPSPVYHLLSKRYAVQETVFLALILPGNNNRRVAF
jgi:hypothetical protein